MDLDYIVYIERCNHTRQTAKAKTISIVNFPQESTTQIIGNKAKKHI